MHDANASHLDLQTIAKTIMEQRGFEPDFPAAVSDQLAKLRQNPPQIAAGGDVRDLRNLSWGNRSQSCIQLSLKTRILTDLREKFGNQAVIKGLAFDSDDGDQTTEDG